MSHSISITICPKPELGFDSPRIREKFNALAPVLENHNVVVERYFDIVDIASGSMPPQNLASLAKELDPLGFSVSEKKTLYALEQ